MKGGVLGGGGKRRVAVALVDVLGFPRINVRLHCVAWLGRIAKKSLCWFVDLE